MISTDVTNGRVFLNPLIWQIFQCAELNKGIISVTSDLDFTNDNVAFPYSYQPQLFQVKFHSSFSSYQTMPYVIP